MPFDLVYRHPTGRRSHCRLRCASSRNCRTGLHAFAMLGPFLVGVTLWLGEATGCCATSKQGLAGTAIVAGLSLASVAGEMARWATEMSLARRRATIGVEALFLAAFVVWTWVRIHDPAAEHTKTADGPHVHEQHMGKPRLPAARCWLHPAIPLATTTWAAAATTLGHLANVPPATAFTIGRGVVWYGLLLTSSFGVAII